jgi:hypothetical protein
MTFLPLTIKTSSPLQMSNASRQEKRQNERVHRRTSSLCPAGEKRKKLLYTSRPKAVVWSGPSHGAQGRAGAQGVKQRKRKRNRKPPGGFLHSSTEVTLGGWAGSWETSLGLARIFVENRCTLPAMLPAKKLTGAGARSGPEARGWSPV